MTVATYEGDGAEEVCYILVSQYIFLLSYIGVAGRCHSAFAASVRDNPSCSAMLMDFAVSHPYFVQLCGFTPSSTMHVVVFHDGMRLDLAILCRSELDC
jgi:hypothetical protein